jgi:membrane protease YdiL (CAAX protease family)
MIESMTNAPLWWTLAAIGAALAGGVVFLQVPPIPGLAGAIEASLYALTAFPAARAWVRSLPHREAWIALSTLPAFLLFQTFLGAFHWHAFLALIVLASVVAWWYRLLPQGLLTDIGFLALMACGLLFGLFPFLYPPLSKQWRTEFIGHIMWLRLSYWVLLTVRDRGEMGFGFLPDRKDWSIGTRWFLYTIPVAAVVLWIVQPMRFKDNLRWDLTPLVAVGTFIGLLWVVALSEELFLRGMLLPQFSKALDSQWLGLLATSTAFGLVHLSFGGKFPNWRMVLLAGILGWFCGRAVQIAGGIRAGMVTHALVVTLYRVFLTPK